MIPGEIRTRPEPLELNAGRERCSLVVLNAGDRPIQIGSHLHLPDANPGLRFDRDEAQGFRLDIPAGTSVRLEPGVSRTVDLVALGGRKYVPGLQLRDLSIREDTAGTDPPRKAPFGTPDIVVRDPHRARSSHMRLSDQQAGQDDLPEGTS